MQDSSIISFISHLNKAEIHYHHCFQLVLTLNEPFNCVIADHHLRSLRGFIVNQSIPHSCDAANTTALVNFIDPESAVGRKLKVLLGKRPFINLKELIELEAIKNVLPAGYESLASGVLVQHITDFVAGLLADVTIPHEMEDSRLEAALHYVKANLAGKLQLEAIAGEMHLSSERTRHYFTAQMGVPFTQYVIWKRLQQVLDEVINQGIHVNLACIDNGFHDQPHFNRVFKRVFGVPPKLLFEKCRFLSN